MIALGLALLVVGLVLVAIEAHTPTLGALGVPGAAALVAGAAFTVGGLGGGIAVAVTVAVLLAAAAGVALKLVLPQAGAVRRRRIRSGPENLLGQIGVVRAWEGEGPGQVLVDGALWRACSADPTGGEDGAEAPLHMGDAVVVERRNGLTLAVRRAEQWEVAP
jgi:membrane-bound serine protease (ClpP class)